MQSELASGCGVQSELAAGRGVQSEQETGGAVESELWLCSLSLTGARVLYLQKGMILSFTNRTKIGHFAIAQVTRQYSPNQQISYLSKAPSILLKMEHFRCIASVHFSNALSFIEILHFDSNTYDIVECLVH